MSNSFNLFLILTFIQIFPSFSSGGASSSSGNVPKRRKLLLEVIKECSSEKLAKEYVEYEECLNMVNNASTPEHFSNILRKV